MKHGEARRLVHALFVDGVLPPGSASRLDEHLRQCSACASLYSRYARLEDALCNAPDKGTVFSRDRVMARVMEQVLPCATGSPKRTSRRARLALSAAVLAAAASLVLVLAPPGRDDSKVDLPPGARLLEVGPVSKGGEATDTSNVGIRMFKVTDRSRLEEAGEKGLDLNDVVTFTYTNVEKGIGYLALFGLQSGPEVHWYYPGYEGSESIRIRNGVVDEPLGHGFKLCVNHEPGPLAVVAVFSGRPLDREELERIVKKKMHSTVGLDQVCPIGVKGVLEHCLFTDIGEPVGHGRCN
ncbi:MAG: hypothetical protein GXP49_11615 [Deltaproteobacteria bacterium]|nr:hypothetical protein [Deltaproteobacteria bacterium]